MWARTTFTPTQPGTLIKIIEGTSSKTGALNKSEFWDSQYTGQCGDSTELQVTIQVRDASGNVLESISGVTTLRCFACEGSGVIVRPN